MIIHKFFMKLCQIFNIKQKFFYENIIYIYKVKHINNFNLINNFKIIFEFTMINDIISKYKKHLKLY